MTPDAGDPIHISMTRLFPTFTEIGIASIRTMGRASAGLTSDQLEAQKQLRAENGSSSLGYGGGIIIPFNERRDMTVTGGTNGSEGGVMVGTEVPEIGFGLRQTSPLDRLGAQTIFGLVSDNKLPSGQAQVVAKWKPEGDPADETTELFDGPLLKPKRVCAILDVSRQLLIQQPAFEAWLRAELFTALNEEIARVAIQGASDGPTGLLNASGIQILDGDTNGSAASMSDLAEMEYLVTNLRSEGRFGFLSSPKVRRKLRQTPRIASTDSATILDDRTGNLLLGYSSEFTKASPDNLTKGEGEDLSAIIFGDWSELFVGFWGPGITVEAIPSFSSKDDFITFVAAAWIDTAPRIPKAFSARNDVLTTLS